MTNTSHNAPEGAKMAEVGSFEDNTEWKLGRAWTPTLIKQRGNYVGAHLHRQRRKPEITGQAYRAAHLMAKSGRRSRRAALGKLIADGGARRQLPRLFCDLMGMRFPETARKS
jgi:hypothetical protein